MFCASVLLSVGSRGTKFYKNYDWCGKILTSVTFILHIYAIETQLWTILFSVKQLHLFSARRQDWGVCDLIQKDNHII